MNFNIFSEKHKKVLVSALGAFLCIFLIAHLNSIDARNVWLIPPFGASLVLVMAVHDSPLASPRNVFLGHVLSASSGVLIFYFTNSVFIFKSDIIRPAIYVSNKIY